MSFSIPPGIQDHWIEIAIAVSGIFLGWLIARMFATGRNEALRDAAHAAERNATEMEARLAHAVSDARHNAQQAQSFANQLADARATPARLGNELAAMLAAIEKRIIALEHAAQFGREELQSRMAGIEHLLRNNQSVAQAPSPFQPTFTVDKQMKEAFSTAGMSDDFAFVPDARSAAGDLRSALE